MQAIRRDFDACELGRRSLGEARIERGLEAYLSAALHSNDDFSSLKIGADRTIGQDA